MTHVINLDINCIPFKTKTHSESLCGFLLQYNNSVYLFSIHHYLPIESITNSNDKSECEIIINSCWSEALIMSSYNIDKIMYTTFKKINNNLKSICDNKIRQNIFTIIENEEVQLDIFGTTFEYFDNFSNSPYTPYILGKLQISKTTIAGSSGSPVYTRLSKNEKNNFEDNNTIIGIISKFDIVNQIVYIIPIYVYLKNLDKKDNTTIYGVDQSIIDNAVKIGTHYNVLKDNLYEKVIYHPTFKINIPLATYFMLEGDTEKIFSITNGSETSNVNTISINDNLIVSHESSILISESRRYKINLRLLSLFKRILNRNTLQKILTKIENNILQTNSNDHWLDIK